MLGLGWAAVLSIRLSLECVLFFFLYLKKILKVKLRNEHVLMLHRSYTCENSELGPALLNKVLRDRGEGCKNRLESALLKRC